jgi:DNA modification methylase
VRPPSFEVIEGRASEVLARLPAGSVQTCVTSPPYYGLRDYGHPDQLGAEASPHEYVERLVAVFEQVRRVLRDDGVLWLNLGDSYAASTGTRYTGNANFGTSAARASVQGNAPRRVPRGLKEKDLIGVPWRVALALQDAGWWLRKDIIWEKPNPTPEAVRDRPTSSHEHLFMLTKAASYFYDVDGYREPAVSDRPSGNGYANPERVHSEVGRQRRNYPLRTWEVADTRQLRDVWRIPTQPFPGAHFAVFPPELPRRCILLGTSPRACDACRAPYSRLVERTRMLDGEPFAGGSWNGDESKRDGHRVSAQGVGHWRFTTDTRTLGWQPTCACGAPPGIRTDDLEQIASPAARDLDEDPSPTIGRAGLARPRDSRSQVRPMTRWEQRQIARQLAGSPHVSKMETEAGADTFAHYLRTDRAGARPPRPDLLDAWVERGWVQRVAPPPAWWNEDQAERCTVLDPFAGAGTTGLVALDEGRDFIGVELNAEYADMARERIAGAAAAPRFEFLT